MADRGDHAGSTVVNGRPKADEEMRSHEPIALRVWEHCQLARAESHAPQFSAGSLGVGSASVRPLYDRTLGENGNGILVASKGDFPFAPRWDFQLCTANDPNSVTTAIRSGCGQAV
jgi:hypothetical protein